MERRLGPLEVVLRDLAADGDAGADVEPRVDGGRDLAAAVVEVHVDAVRARLLECGTHVVVLVVDGGVVAERLQQLALLLLAAGDSDGAAARELRQLTDELADRACRSGDDDGVSRPRLADVEQPEVRGQTVRAEHMQVRLQRRTRHDLADAAGARDRVLLPAELTDDVVARFVARVVAIDNFGDGLRSDDVAELERPRVRAHLAHAATLVRVDGKPERAEEHLAGLGFADLRVAELEVGWLREADGPGRKRHLSFFS